MSLCMALFLCMSFWQVSYGKTSNPLNDFINHYEPLNYAAKPKLSRGAAESGRTRNMDFTAHGRTFKLNLRPDTTTLAPGAQIIDGDGKGIEFDKDSLIMGDLVAEPGSSVHGVLHDDGTFTGKIYSKDGIFFVESAHRYFDKPTDFHSVIYKDEDVAYDLNFAKPKEAPVASNDVEEDLQSSKSGRHRRASGDQFAENTCFLSMEADYTFLEMAKEAKLAVGEIIKHVQALNIIYSRTFNTSGTYAPYSIKFRVGRLRVYNKTQTLESLQPQNLDISTFLTRMTATDYSKFCEAVYFTNRDFEGGILGLAYIGNPTGAGGICDGRRNSKSYNTAVVTFSLQGRHSPPKVSEITFVHEVGHAFGSGHDDDSCTPGGHDGNYIMYDKATSGDRFRNDVFSPCSIRQMKANIKVKRPKTIDRNAKPIERFCLESLERMLMRKNDFCGNGVVDGKEECDCGPKAFCEVLEPKGCCNWQTCKLNSLKECSPSQGPCCDKNTCKPVDNEPVCNEGYDCLKKARCPSHDTIMSTKNFKCPSPKLHANGTECDRGTRLCHKGMCTRSICTKHKLTPCECKAAKEECQACCMDGNVCRPAYKITQLKREFSYNFSVGTPCANNTGYCDFFHYCQKVNMEGPLLQLFNLYFTSEGVKELTRKYWWAILLGTVGLVAIVVLLVIFGARYTTSDNPHHPAAKPLPCLCCGKSSDRTDARELKHFEEEKSGDKTL